MIKPSAFEMIRKFRERVDRKSLTEDVKFVYRMAGGMPSERVEEEFRLSGSGKANMMVRDVLRSMPAQRVSVELDHAETLDLFQKIGQGLDRLVPRSEARFLPDSLVGSITFEVGGDEATLYFLADEEERLAQNKPIAPQMAEAIQQVRGISQQLLKKGRRKSNE